MSTVVPKVLGDRHECYHRRRLGIVSIPSCLHPAVSRTQLGPGHCGAGPPSRRRNFPPPLSTSPLARKEKRKNCQVDRRHISRLIAATYIYIYIYMRQGSRFPPSRWVWVKWEPPPRWVGVQGFTSPTYPPMSIRENSESKFWPGGPEF